jgi:hypothetical protein
VKLWEKALTKARRTNQAARNARAAGSRSIQYLAQLNLFGGAPSGTLTQNGNEIGSDYRGVIEGAYKANGVVFACMLSRMLLFSEARFRFRQEVNGRPGDLFGTTALKPLEQPWHGATTGDLLSRMIQDADLGGNAFVRRLLATRSSDSTRNGRRSLPATPSATPCPGRSAPRSSGTCTSRPASNRSSCSANRSRTSLRSPTRPPRSAGCRG